MNNAAPQPYPGDFASPQQVRQLADEYRRAAHLLAGQVRRREPLSRAPFRLSALQAIELYLSAFLLHQGWPPHEVRGLQHDITARVGHALLAGLKLKERTIAHLRTLAASREYLILRYGPELIDPSTQSNRLTATLEELAGKLTELMAQPPAPDARL